MTNLGTTRIVKPLTAFDSVLTTAKTPIFQPVNSIWNVSALRDIDTTTNSATITTANGEFVLNTGTTTASSADLRTNERGRYVAGQECQAGIGVRIDDTFTGTAYAKWGYYDDDDGFGYGVDSTGIYIFIRRNGTDTKTHQTDWNVDKLDGTGKSGFSLDNEDGNIYQMEFVWYGYGPIEFQVALSREGEKQEIISCHIFEQAGQTSVTNPNLPVTAEISNGDTTDDLTLYVTGRQFSVLGEYNPTRRFTSDYRLQLGSVGTTFLPTVSFRKKSTRANGTIRLGTIEVITDADILYQVRLNATLTGASYGTPTDTTATETFVESDTSATAVSNGELLYQGLIAAGGGSRSELGGITNLPISVPAAQPITLCVRRVSGSNATVDVVFQLIEEW